MLRKGMQEAPFLAQTTREKWGAGFKFSPCFLTLPYGCRAAERVYVPELNVFRQVFYADLALHFRPGLAQPNDPELRFRALILNVDDVAGLEARAYALQSRAASADGAQAGGLREWTGVGVHAPDFYWEFDENAGLPAAVHADDGKGAALGNIGNLGHGTEVPKVRAHSLSAFKLERFR